MIVQPKVTLLNADELRRIPPEVIIGEFASVCYDSDGDPAKIAKHCIESGHTSVTSAVSFRFHIEGVSRAFSHQQVRHNIGIRHAQRSQRWVDEEGCNFIVPPSIEAKGGKALEMFEVATEVAKTAYEQLKNLGIPAEDARFVLPNATETQMNEVFTFEALMHYCHKRLCTRCYDDQTEVLTNHGWKLFKDVTFDDLFYSLNPETMETELLPALDLIAIPYVGNMVRTTAQSIDLLVTPNHKNFVSYSYERKDFHLDRADASFDKKRVLMKKNCHPIQGKMDQSFIIKSNVPNQLDREVPTEKLFRFLGMYISDGWVCNAGAHFNVGIAKGDETLIDYYRQLLSDLTPNSVRKIKDGTSWKIEVHDHILYDFLKPLGKALEKHIPAFVWEYDHALLQHLFSGLMDGDAHTEKRYGTSTYYTSSKQLADDVQRLLLHIGYSGTVSIDDRRGITSKGRDHDGNPYEITTRNIAYHVHINRSKNEPIIKTKQRNPFSNVAYAGMVYCATLPQNHTLYVRRNGKSVWSGNSQWEIREVADQMVLEVRKVSPFLANYLGPQCMRLGYCPEKKGCGLIPSKKAVLDGYRNWHLQGRVNE